MAANYEKDLIRIFTEGRSVAIKPEKDRKQLIVVSEGIVHEGEIVWDTSSFAWDGVKICSCLKISATKGLEPGQKVVLLFRSAMDDNPKIVPEAYDDFMEKISNMDDNAVRIICELALDVEVDEIFHKAKFC